SRDGDLEEGSSRGDVRSPRPTMASLADNLFAHAMELARAVPGTAVLAGVLVGFAVFVTSYLLYQLTVRAQSEPRVVYVMPYPVMTAAPLRRSELCDRESCVETGPMSVVTIAR